MASASPTGTCCSPPQRDTRGVAVRHMPGDYWRTGPHPRREDAAGDAGVAAGGEYDVAVLRVHENGDNMPIGNVHSARLTH